jgi:hypothetical protein
VILQLTDWSAFIRMLIQTIICLFSYGFAMSQSTET